MVEHGATDEKDLSCGVKRNDLFEILKKNRDKIRQLHNVALQLSKAENEERIYDLIIEASRRILKFDTYSLDIVEGENLVVKRISECVTDSDAQVYSKKDGIAGRTLREGRTIALGSLAGNSEAKPIKSDYKSALSIPVGIYGVFQTASNVENAYREEDIDLAELLIAHAVEAISRVRARKEIFRLTYHDCLTGALSRYGLSEFAMMEIEKARRCDSHLSMIMIDIDNFKAINDSMGHVYGDFILSWIVRKVKEVIRGSDLIIRWGGDEFILMLAGSDRSKANMTAERIRSHIKSECEKENVKVTVSMGLTCYHGTGDDVDQMISRADTALYTAKRQGKDCLRTF